MSDIVKSEFSNFKRTHFAKLHERIQNKYDEMQRKLEKSKSVDVLSTLKDDYAYKTKFASTLDITVESDEVFEEVKKNKHVEKHTLFIKEMHRNDANLEYVDFKESSISESEGITPLEKSESAEDKFFGDEFSKLSLESLNEVATGSDGEFTPPTTPQKISIRHRIGSKISAVKEKRWREEKAKNPNKDRKKEHRDKVEKFILSNTTKQDLRILKKTKLGTVTIALINATGFDNDGPEERNRMLLCRFRLGTEKHKSKTVKGNKNKMKWQELFNLSIYEEHLLELSLWDKDFCIGRNIIDLNDLEKEKTHEMRVKIEGEVTVVHIFMLITISGIPIDNTIADLDDYEATNRELDVAKKKFAWYHLGNSDEVGCLSVLVYGAKGLNSNDTCCVLELDNERLQTHIEVKTNEPNWMKVFTFVVYDITSVLEVTIHDEKRSEDIAKISIPLLRIDNGVKKWYALKHTTQRERAKGTNPRILLEMKVTWNLMKASLRSLTPKQTKYLETKEKFDRHVFARNISRAKYVTSWMLSAIQTIKTCFEWESRKSNVMALTLWLLFCWFFKTWMLPLLLLIPFVWYRPPRYYLVNWKRYFSGIAVEDDHLKKDKDEKNTTLRQKINSLQEMVQTVQNFIGKFASLHERVKNLFNFTVPFLSFLAIFLIIVIALIMFIIPVKYIFMGWGVHKFTRKILRPNRIPNNEILDLLSRIPDDEALLDCEELPLEESEKDVLE